ncbi:hypothetical protein OS035_28170 [Rhizobium sp. 268]|uniref:hypothetical protein n=1 Tax=Rhizobium sp. 268 TaxID=2996375 RepID=UPI001615636A
MAGLPAGVESKPAGNANFEKPVDLDQRGRSSRVAATSDRFISSKTLAETNRLTQLNSVELNARNIEIVGSTCLISPSSIFKPQGAILTSPIVMSIKATPM